MSVKFARGLIVAIGAGLGVWAGGQALELVRRYRQPCPACRKLEETGLAPVIASSVGGFLAAILAQRVAGKLVR